MVHTWQYCPDTTKDDVRYYSYIYITSGCVEQVDRPTFRMLYDEVTTLIK